MFPTTVRAPLQRTAASTAEPLIHREVPDADESARGSAREPTNSTAHEVTFVTGNEKKRKEVEEILRNYQTPFLLISEKVGSSTASYVECLKLFILISRRVCLLYECEWKLKRKEERIRGKN